LLQRQRANDEAARAEQEATAATAARAASDVDRLRSQAVAMAPERPDVAALLAVEASRIDPSTRTDDALQRVLTAIPSYRGHIPTPAFPPLLAADGTTLAVFGPELEIWDLRTLTRRQAGAPRSSTSRPVRRWRRRASTTARSSSPPTRRRSRSAGPAASRSWTHRRSTPSPRCPPTVTRSCGARPTT
jgi:hypothetical protein